MQWDYEQKHRIINGIIYKVCSQCKNWFPMNEEYFYKWNRNRDKLSAQCIKCSLKYAKKRREEKGDIVRNNESKIYYKNREKRIQDITKYQYKSEDIQKHIRNYRKNYIKTHPEKMALYSKKHHIKKHIITNQEWINCKEYFNNTCAYCGLSAEEHYVVRYSELTKIDLCRDHVIDNGRNDIKNCIPSCNLCNDSKKQKTLNKFYNSNNPNYTYERYFRIYQWLRYDYKKYIMPKRRYKGQHLSARLKEIEEYKIKRLKNK